jgi:Kef-type K+ transport system membrane component KefB
VFENDWLFCFFPRIVFSPLCFTCLTFFLHLPRFSFRSFESFVCFFFLRPLSFFFLTSQLIDLSNQKRKMGFFNGEPLEAQASFLSRFLVQLVIILTLPRILHFFLAYLKQPRVLSEILSGIILGPTVMGLIPGFTTNIFPTRSIPYLNALAQLGMILYLFMVGLGLDVNQIYEYRYVTLLAVVLADGLPFVVSIGISKAFEDPKYTTANSTELILLISALILVSALAVLARILGERKMLVSRLGSIAMSTTAIDTFIAWLMLAVVLALYGARTIWKNPNKPCPGQVVISPVDSNSTMDPLYIFICFCALVAVIIFPGRLIMEKIALRVQHKGRVEMAIFVLTMILVCMVSYVSQTLTVSGMLGAFAFGLVGVPRIGTYCHDIRRMLESLVVGVFLPIFFCLSGLRTDWTLLSWHEVGLAVLLAVATFFTKFVSCYIAAWIFNMRGFKGLYFGLLMTCKGLTVLAMLNVCLDIGIVTKTMFALSVLFVILCIIFVSPIFSLLQIFDRMHKKSRAKQVEDEFLTHILLVPRTPFYSETVGFFGTLVLPSFPKPSVTVARLITEMEDTDLGLFQSIARGVLVNRIDPILSPVSRMWKTIGVSAPLTVRSVLAPSPVSDFTHLLTGDDPDHKAKKPPFDVIIMGYDDTHETSQLINVCLESPEKTVISIHGQTEVSIVSPEKILVIDDGPSSQATHQMWLPSLLQRFPNTQVYWWQEDGQIPKFELAKPPIRYEFSGSLLDLVVSVHRHEESDTTVYEHFSFIVCPFDAHTKHDLFSRIHKTLTPFIFIRAGSKQELENVAVDNQEPRDDIEIVEDIN